MKSKKLIIIASVLLFLAIIGTVLFFILGRDKAFVGEEGILYVKNGDMYYYDSSMEKPDLLIEKITEEEAAFEKFYAADVIKGESFILYSEAETGGSRVYYVNIKNQDKTGVFIDKDVATPMHTTLPLFMIVIKKSFHYCQYVNTAVSVQALLSHC